MDNPVERAGGKIAHLENLFLIAQFYARDADEAAQLIDRVYTDINAAAGANLVTLSTLVEKLVSMTRTENMSRLGLATPSVDAQTARALEADRFLDDHCRLRFLSLSSDEKLELWHAVETGSDSRLLMESDALGFFVQTVERLLSEDERAVFGSFIHRSSVAGSLRRYWNTDFIPVPPTLRSVVESRERRAGGGSHEKAVTGPSETVSRRRHFPFRRVVTYAWVVLAAAGLGYLLTRIGEPTPPSTDIIQLSLSASEDLDLTFRTDNAEQAERFIQDRFGWRLSLPEIEETSLEGVSLVSVLDSVELPVIVFTDLKDNSRVPIFSFSYTFLQSHRDQFNLSSETLRQIQESGQFDVHEFKEKAAVVWRNRDDIFTAFVSRSDQEFQSRITIRS